MSLDINNKADNYLAGTYKRFPITIKKGKGCMLWDTENRSYTDFVAGIAVCNLGHSHPDITKVVARQADKLLHVSNLYYTLPQIDLAKWLVQNSFADKVFFCNSGAEANEAAIKIARKHFQDKGETDRCRIVCFDQSFHGRTMATLSATGQDKIKKGYKPLLEGFDFVAFNDIEALKNKITSLTCAVLIEPVQGEGGVRCPDPDFIKAVRKICDDTKTLLIFDEVQTGIGRTGKLFAYEHFGITPDIMTLAKALANGFPIGAMLAKNYIAETFGHGSHATTFGGNPIVTAVSMEVMRILTNDRIIDNCYLMGNYFKKKLLWLKERHNSIVDVRGIGLLLGMKIKTDGDLIVRLCMEKGFLINCIQGNILRFIPPLIIKEHEIDSLISCLDDIL